ncbi:MAG: Mo-dependent nitrogenase C-terminal domain-containing protein [Synechococcus sp.]
MIHLPHFSHPVSSPPRQPAIDIFKPLRRWLDGIEFHTPQLARMICKLIPCRCPFERDVTIFGRTIHIPALCKINPVYEELVSLRLRALTYLAEVCEEDVTQYVC